MKYSIEQLQEKAKVYFEGGNAVSKIIATDDGHFFEFSAEGIIHARNYAFSQKIDMSIITEGKKEVETKTYNDKIELNPVVEKKVSVSSEDAEDKSKSKTKSKKKVKP